MWRFMTNTMYKHVKYEIDESYATNEQQKESFEQGS